MSNGDRAFASVLKNYCAGRGIGVGVGVGVELRSDGSSLEMQD